MPHNQTLLTLKVNGRRCHTKLRTRLPARPPFVGNFLNKKYEDIQRRFVFEADPNSMTNRESFANGTYYRYCQLDNTCIDDARVTVFSNDAYISNLKTLYREVGYIDTNEKFHFCSITSNSIMLYLHDVEGHNFRVPIFMCCKHSDSYETCHISLPA